MATRGKSKQQKRLSSAKILNIQRKAFTWLVSTRPGPRAKDEAVPLAVVLRDQLHLVDSRREAKYLVRNGKVHVDGKAVYDDSYAVGVFDVVSVPEAKKHYRMSFDAKGRLVPKEVKADNHKIARVEKKTAVKAGNVQVTLSDGRNLLLKGEEAGKYATGDSLKISLPDQKIAGHYAYEKGSLVYVVKGRHTGQMGTVEEMVASSLGKKATLMVKPSKEEPFQTVAENVLVVGKGKEAIEF